MKPEAEIEVVELWRSWDNKSGKTFFERLREKHSHPLAFRSADDKWQVVSGWIQSS